MRRESGQAMQQWQSRRCQLVGQQLPELPLLEQHLQASIVMLGVKVVPGPCHGCYAIAGKGACVVHSHFLACGAGSHVAESHADTRWSP